MELYYKDSNTTLYSGDMNDVNSVVMDNSVDCIITDPPYELGFMGKSWDSSGIAFQKETWKHCFDVLKPGGHLLAFGGSRTFHRIACAIEDAGFEIRDTIMWVYGSGFPKSMSISKGIESRERFGNAGTRCKRLIEQSCDGEEFIVKQTNNGAMGEIVEATRKHCTPTSELAKKWNGWGTQLKPAYEPIIVARKPFNGSLVDNVIAYGVGGINIDECRVPFESTPNPATNPLYRVKNGYTWNKDFNAVSATTGFSTSNSFVNDRGRFPSNLILTYDETDKEEVIGGFPETKSTGGSGELSVKGGLSGKVYQGGWSHDKAGSHIGGIGDEGSASRYFYCAKASKRDRDEGLHAFFEKTKVFNGKSKESSKSIKDVEKRFTTALKNYHPTVKPTSLMQYLIRLVSPKGATILDPFMGSGSTGKALMYENNDRGADYKFIGVELTDEYLPIAKARILFAKGDKEPVLDTVENETTNKVQEDTKPLVERFDFGV